MRTKLKLFIYGMLIVLCITYSGDKVSAEAATHSMKIQLETSEIDDPMFTEDDYIVGHISDEIGLDDSYDIKLISKKITEREIYVEFNAKYSKIPGIQEVADTITIPGDNKGDKLKQQMRDALKAKCDRLEEVYEITCAEANYIDYDVTYELSKQAEASLNKSGQSTESTDNKKDLNVESTYLCKGETLQLKVLKLPKKIKWIKWDSDDSKVAKVSKSKVTALNYGSTIINVSFQAAKKDYYYSCYVTVYKLNGFEQYSEKVSKIELDRGEGNFDENGVTVGLNIKGAEQGVLPYQIPCSRVKVDISSTGDNLAKIKTETSKGVDGNEYIDAFNIETYRDGIVTITISDFDTTYKLEIVIGTGVSRLDPVEAVKKNDFTGYEGYELQTLQKVREFIDKYDLYSETMSTEEKIGHIVDYFMETLNDKQYKPIHGVIYYTFIEGHGVCGDYSETFCFLCDCLDIKNMEEDGIAYNGDSTEAHAWNKVEVDGKWYYIDAFWCACVKSKDKYYLTEVLWDDHILGYEDNYYGKGDIPYINDLS